MKATVDPLPNTIMPFLIYPLTIYLPSSTEEAGQDLDRWRSISATDAATLAYVWVELRLLGMKRTRVSIS